MKRLNFKSFMMPLMSRAHIQNGYVPYLFCSFVGFFGVFFLLFFFCFRSFNSMIFRNFHIQSINFRSQNIPCILYTHPVHDDNIENILHINILFGVPFGFTSNVQNQVYSHFFIA